MKLWLARDKNDQLFIFSEKPERVGYLFYAKDGCFKEGIFCYATLPSKSFQEVTWENSPVEVELKIVKTGERQESTEQSE